jgi:hypothetical protein
VPTGSFRVASIFSDGMITAAALLKERSARRGA